MGTARPEIRVVLMVTRSSLPRLAELVRSVAAHGADALALRHLWHDAVAARRFVEAESLLGETPDFSEAQAVAAELGLALSLPQARLGGPCDRPWRALHLGASGEVLPCAMAKTAQRLSFGSARREGVVKIWNGDAFREFRERVGTDAAPALCRQCTRQL
jgi:radical SAM protein with 4Fe4S-binding SPASM domain